jgi:hypothetical protein
MAAHAPISNRTRRRFSITRIALLIRSRPFPAALFPGYLRERAALWKAGGVEPTLEKSLLCDEPLPGDEEFMSWVFRVALGLAAGYVIGALLGFGAVHAFSANMHDRAVEAAMTAAFGTGPLGAALGAAVALIAGRRR